MSQTQVAHIDSIEEEDPYSGQGKKQKSRRPASTQIPSQVQRFAPNKSNIVVPTQILLSDSRD